MKKPRTVKQRKFLRHLIRTLEPTEAAMQSYNCKDRLVARSIANQLLTRLDVNMGELMDKMGLDSERDIADLKKLREAKTTKHFAYEGEVFDSRDYDDNATQLKALELSLKLKGVLKDKAIEFKNETNVNVHRERVYVFTDDREKVEECDKRRFGEREGRNIYDTEGTESNKCEETV